MAIRFLSRHTILTRSRLLRLALAWATLSLFQASAARGNTWYVASLAPLPGGQAVSDGAALTCGFPRDPLNNHLPACSTDEPMWLSLHFPDIEGTVAAIVLRLDRLDGTEFARVASADDSIRFDADGCDILYDREFVEDVEVTPLFVVIETSAYPQGAIGGRLGVVEEQPTLEWSWGRIKGAFQEAVEAGRPLPTPSPSPTPSLGKER